MDCLRKNWTQPSYLASEQKFIAQILFEEEEQQEQEQEQEDYYYYCPHCHKMESKVALAVKI
jgi:hypothetical protein